MGNKIEADEFLKEYAKENPELTSSLAPDFEKIESGAIGKLKKPRAGLRIAAGIAAIFLIFAAGAFFTDSGIVRAYRQKALVFLSVVAGEGSSVQTGDAVISNQPDVAAAQKKVSYHIPEPHWLPEGFAFESIKLTDSKDGMYRVVLKYINAAEKRVVLTYNNDTDGLTSTTPAPDEPKLEEIDVQGTKVYYLKPADATKPSYAIFISKDGLLTSVSAPVDKQGMLQLIMGLY